MSRRVIVALGGNLGDRAAILAAAAREIASIPGVRIVVASRLYETPALTLEGMDETAPRFLNAALRLEVDGRLDPRRLLDELRAIEDEAGRQRVVRWGSRTLDLDLIDVEGVEQEDRILTLPHPRAAERAFVLAPWLDVEPDGTVPGRGPIAVLREQAGDRVEAVGRLVLDDDGAVRALLDPAPSRREAVAPADARADGGGAR